MTLRARLFLLVGATVGLTVVVVTIIVSSSARRAFATLDAQRTEAMVAQFRREFASEGEQVALRLERVAASDTIRRTAVDVAAHRDQASHVNDATEIASAQGLDFLDVVAANGTIISSAHWPARFGYRHTWATNGSPSSSAGFLQAVELPEDTALGLVAVRAVPAGDGNLYLAGGRQLDAEFLQSLVLPPGMRVLLYRNLEPEISRRQLVAASGNVSQQAPLEPLISRVRETGREAVETIDWPDGAETVHAIPLAGREGQVLGVLLVGSSGRELAALVRSIRWSGFALGGLGMALGLAVSYLMAGAGHAAGRAARLRGTGSCRRKLGCATGRREEPRRDCRARRRFRNDDQAAGRSSRTAGAGGAGGGVAGTGTPARARVEEPSFSAAHHARQPAPRQAAAAGSVRRSVRRKRRRTLDRSREPQHRDRAVQRFLENAGTRARGCVAQRGRRAHRHAIPGPARRARRAFDYADRRSRSGSRHHPRRCRAAGPRNPESARQRH